MKPGVCNILVTKHWERLRRNAYSVDFIQPVAFVITAELRTGSQSTKLNDFANRGEIK
jgi:hypothetical protein